MNTTAASLRAHFDELDHLLGDPAVRTSPWDAARRAGKNASALIEQYAADGSEALRQRCETALDLFADAVAGLVAAPPADLSPALARSLERRPVKRDSFMGFLEIRDGVAVVDVAIGGGILQLSYRLEQGAAGWIAVDEGSPLWLAEPKTKPISLAYAKTKARQIARAALLPREAA